MEFCVELANINYSEASRLQKILYLHYSCDTEFPHFSLNQYFLVSPDFWSSTVQEKIVTHKKETCVKIL